MRETTIHDAVLSAAPVSRRAFVAATGGGILGLALTLQALGGSAPSPAWAQPSVAAAAEGEWSLTVVRGSVALQLTADVLSRFEVTTRAVPGPGSSPASWSGVALADLFAAVGAGRGARARILSSARTGDGTVTTVLTPSAAGGRALVATALNGRALSAGEGAPARLIPGRSSRGTGPLGRVLRIEVLG